ncbi:MAG TPA: ABC transporter transmembrane domain-containing protein, partial [Puia sp.]
MKILLTYLKPYKGLVALALFMAAINQTFSMLDPYFFGKIGLDKLAFHPHDIGYYDASKVWVSKGPRSQQQFIWAVMGYLGILIGVAMVSRIAKAFQDYFGNVVVQKFGATIFTDGLSHAMALPFSEFEDQRSGETLSILSKVRLDTERFIISFINVLFGIIVGVVVISIYSFTLHWSIMPMYVLGMILLSLLISVLSKKIKRIQKTIVAETNALAGSTTESLRNIELVKSLGLREQEVTRLNNNTFKILGLELRKVKSIRALSFIQGTFVNFLRQCIMFLLLWLVFGGRLTAGEVLTMVFYSFFIFGPLQELGNIILIYREAEASLINFHNLMQKKPEMPPVKPHHLGPIKTLAFRD